MESVYCWLSKAPKIEPKLKTWEDG